MKKYVVGLHGELSGVSFVYEVKAKTASSAVGAAARKAVRDGDFDLDFDPPALDFVKEDIPA